MFNVTRSSWLNSALRDDKAVYWVSIGHYEAVAVDTELRFVNAVTAGSSVIFLPAM